MLSLLRRIFIRDYQNLNDPKVRAKHGLLSAWFGIVTNLVLVAMKLCAAFIMYAYSGFAVISMALVADAVNNISDTASSVVTLLSFRWSEKPPDKEHPFGHERSEYVGGLIVSVIIVALAAILLEDSIVHSIEGSEVAYDLTSVIIMGIAVFLKLMQSLFNYRMGKLIGSQTLKATAFDSLGDAVSSCLIMVSAILSMTLGWNHLDSYVGIAVALFVGFGGAKMIKESVSILLGKAGDKKEAEEILALAKNHPEILGCHDLIIHDYGPHKRYVSFHAEVDEKSTLTKAHEAVDELESEIRAKFGYEVTIHLDPVAVNDTETEALRAEIAGILKNISIELTFHDLRLVKGKEGDKIIFDVMVPYGFELSDEELVGRIRKGLNGSDAFYRLIVNIDHPYQA